MDAGSALQEVYQRLAGFRTATVDKRDKEEVLSHWYVRWL